MVGRLLHGPRQGGTASCRVWAVNHFRFHYGVVACTQDATPPTGSALTPAFLQDLAYRSMELQAKATCDVTLVVLHSHVLCRPCRRRPTVGMLLRRKRWRRRLLTSWQEGHLAWEAKHASAIVWNVADTYIHCFRSIMYRLTYVPN